MNDMESNEISEKTEETVASLAGMSGFVVESTDVLPTFQELKTDEVDEVFKSVIEVTDAEGEALGKSAQSGVAPDSAARDTTATDRDTT